MKLIPQKLFVPMVMNSSVVKKSNYIGNKDSRDARKYDLGGKTGIYFYFG